MPSFRFAANDEAVEKCIDRRKETLRESLKDMHTLVEELRAKLEKSKAALEAWKTPREGMLSQAGSVKDYSEEAEDIEKLLETGLKWEVFKPVVKARRPVPAPKDGSEVPAVPPPEALLVELRSVVDDAYRIDKITSNVMCLIDFVEPCPVEGQDPPTVLLSLKAVVASIWGAMAPVKKISLEYLQYRAHCEEEYYKEFLTCDWREIIEAHDYCTFQKVIRCRKLFNQVLLYMSDLIIKNVEKFDVYLDPKKRKFAEKKTTHMMMA